MPIVIPPISVMPSPPAKADFDSFGALADAFLTYLQTFDSELDALIPQLNVLFSGLDGAGESPVYSNTATYNFPDVVVGADGFLYRCVGTSVVGDDPVLGSSNWQILISPYPLSSPRKETALSHVGTSNPLTVNAAAGDVFFVYNITVSPLSIEIANLAVGAHALVCIYSPGLNLVEFSVSGVTSLLYNNGEITDMDPTGISLVTVFRLSSTEATISIRTGFNMTV